MNTNPTAAPSPSQRREQADPSERSQPIPLLVAGLTVLMVLLGAGYIAASESFGHSDLGDQRTMADLSGASAASKGTVDGKQVFAANCAACHQTHGKGLPGVFPPLDGSEWVNGNTRVLANILLHGINGEITVAGNTYKGSMPSFQALGDAELAAVAGFVRSQWSNRSAPLDAELFRSARSEAVRTTPFESGEQLKALAARTPG